MSRVNSRGRRRCAVLMATILLVGGLAAAGAQAQQDGPAARVGALLDQAKDLGAKGQLPTAWWDLDERYKRARDDATDDATWAALESDARRLVNQATFIEEMRRRKSGMEAMLGRFDQALAEIGALYGVAPDPELTGTAAARDLLDRLDAENLRRQVLIDSLTVNNRGLSELAGGQAAGRDSLIAALQVDVSRLRQRLWETELRAGVAEADRSAAETVLTVKQQREAAVAAVRALFTTAEAEILQTGGGDLLLRVHGLDFAVGSANLKPGQGDLVDRLADALRLFPSGAGAPGGPHRRHGFAGRQPAPLPPPGRVGGRGAGGPPGPGCGRVRHRGLRSRSARGLERHARGPRPEPAHRRGHQHRQVSHAG